MQNRTHKGLSGPVFSGLLWLLSQTLVNRGVTFISQLVLAQLLLPEDFGVWGLALTIAGIFSLLASVGVDQALQQRANKMPYWATQAFLFSLTASSLAALAMAAFAPFGAALYGNEVITQLVWILALAMPFQALGLVPQVNLQRQLKFKTLALYNSMETFGVQGLIIFMAWKGYGAVSFVVPIVLFAVFRPIFLWSIAPVPLDFSRRFKGFRPLIKRSLDVWEGILCTTLIGQGDYIILGLMAPLHTVGAYFFAFRLAFQPIKIFANNLSNVLFPAISLMQNERIRQRNASFKASSLLIFLVAPLALMQAALAKPLFLLLFGEKWVDAIIYFQILSLGLPFDVFSWPAGAFLKAQGLFSLRTRYLFISTIFFFILVPVGGFFGGALGVASCVALYYFFHAFFFSAVIYIKNDIRPSVFLRAYLLPSVLALFSIAPFYLLVLFVPAFSSLWVQLFVPIVFGGLLYLLLSYLFMRETFMEIWQRGVSLIKKKKQKVG